MFQIDYPVVTIFPNISTSSSSLDILTIEETGPFEKFRNNRCR